MRRKRKIYAAGIALAGTYVGMKALANATREKTSIDDDNPYLDPAGTENTPKRGVYERVIKPGLDSALSFCGMIALLPFFAVTAVAVYLDDPGPVFFSQKRVGKDGRFFYLHKFRSMKMSTPHDVPTHLLENPEQYITRIGKILRKTSLDEMPQIWDIFRGKMSVIGPRPALWNQNDLIAEREKYGANSVMPGITGLAQINGRDELSIEEKARLDGVYTAKLRKDGMTAFAQDATCFFKTILSVLKHDGVVEGGTGTTKQSEGASG